MLANELFLVTELVHVYASSLLAALVPTAADEYRERWNQVRDSAGQVRAQARDSGAQVRDSACAGDFPGHRVCDDEVSFGRQEDGDQVDGGHFQVR